MNPYSGAGFFEFFAILFQRLFSFQPLASDEIQLAVLSASALACGLLGPFVVLKRMAMFANSLSHTTLIGIVVAALSSSLWGGEWGDLTTLLIGAVVAALLTAGLTELFSRFLKLGQDASIGLVFTSLFAVGIVLVTLFAKHSHLGVEAVMGHPDALRLSDLKLAGTVLVLNGIVIGFFHRKLSLIAFDEPCARVLGVAVPFWRIALYFLTALTCIGAFRAVGVLVVLALLVGPYLTARLFFHRLGKLLFWTPVFGIVACVLGVAISRAVLTYTGLALSTSGLVATTIGLLFVGALGVKKFARNTLALLR